MKNEVGPLSVLRLGEKLETNQRCGRGRLPATGKVRCMSAREVALRFPLDLNGVQRLSWEAAETWKTRDYPPYSSIALLKCRCGSCIFDWKPKSSWKHGEAVAKQGINISLFWTPCQSKVRVFATPFKRLYFTLQPLKLIPLSGVGAKLTSYIGNFRDKSFPEKAILQVERPAHQYALAHTIAISTIGLEKRIHWPCH